MSSRPDAVELLDAARETLKALVSDLPSEKQYDALMILNAMAIAMREVTHAQTDSIVESRDFATIYPKQTHDGASVDDLARQLVVAIRTQQHDTDSVVYEVLCRSVERKLRVSNPKYLHSYD